MHKMAHSKSIVISLPKDCFTYFSSEASHRGIPLEVHIADRLAVWAPRAYTPLGADTDTPRRVIKSRTGRRSLPSEHRQWCITPTLARQLKRLGARLAAARGENGHTARLSMSMSLQWLEVADRAARGML